MLTMFPMSVSVEQEKKNLEVYYFSTNIFDTTFGREQKAYCQMDRPGQNVTVCSSRAQRYI